MEKTNDFHTSEYYLAITLLVLKENLIIIEKNNYSNRATFIFKQSSTLDRNIDDYRKGKILVEPQTLFMQHKLLKGRLYNNH